MDREKALELARKLANFTSQNGATQNEVELAATRLQKLMNDHNLSQMDLAPEDQGKKVGEDSQAYKDWTTPPMWLRWFVHDIGQCFRVKVIWHTWKQEISFIGDETNVALAKYFCACVLELPRIRWMNQAKRELEKRGQKAPHGYKLNFYMGMVKAIMKRLHDEYDAWFSQLAEAQKNSMRALIVVETNAVAKYVEQRYPSLRTMSQGRSYRHDAGAEAAGYAKGMKAELNKGLRATPTHNPNIA